MKEIEWVTVGNERTKERETTQVKVRAWYSNIEINWKLKLVILFEKWAQNLQYISK